MTRPGQLPHATAQHLAEPWRFVYASALGTSHGTTGTPCQDAALSRVVASPAGDVLIVACADGAGSASHSQFGAQWACETVVGEISDFLEGGQRVEEVTRAKAEEWVLQVQRCLVERAAEHEVVPRQLACTLLVAVLGQQASVFLQIGDGAIVVARAAARPGDAPGGPPADQPAPPAAAEYAPVFWPQSGEYANTTYFVTEPEALMHLVFDAGQGRVDEVAVFTDGIQSLALRYEERAAHAPFFRPMFARLRAEPAGQAVALAEQVALFLASDAVNARTDDDKTLALATRVAPSPTEPTAAAPRAPTVDATPATTPTADGDAPQASAAG